MDGWSDSEPVREVALEHAGGGEWRAEVDRLGGHLAMDVAVTDGDDWDNNDGADYRLWITLDPVDSHLHAGQPGDGRCGARSLRTAMWSAGIRTGVVSWRDNRFVERLAASDTHLRPLVWVLPRQMTAAAVERRLTRTHVGLKLHPTVDRYRADDRRLDPFVRAAEAASAPVAVHSAPGDADPDNIRRLAERFPSVAFVLYHTYLGPPEGRRRAARHAAALPNLYLETSWCVWREAQWLVDAVGPDRVLFGSDAVVDGPRHYRQSPPNVEGRETYNAGMIALARALGPGPAEQVFSANARRLFRM
jgi:predicted TIM-barrel fold metal-dependent hydrolase